MKCSCPKCRAHVELDLPEVPEEGTRVSCDQCKARFMVSRESFGGRALRKTGEITCAACGERLGPTLNCQGCGVLFPSYLVTSLGGKKARAKKLKLKTSPFPQRAHTRVDLPRIDAPLQQTVSSAPKTKTTPFTKRPRLFAALALLLVLCGVGTALYLHQKNAQEFTKNFIKTIYCTKVGERKALEACTKMAADWKAKGDVVPHLSPDDLRDLSVPRDEVTILQRKLQGEKPPKNLAASMEKLGALCAAYDKALILASSPSGSLDSFAAASAKADSDYRAAARELKGTLPPEVVAQIRTSSQRYKGLQGFLEL